MKKILSALVACLLAAGVNASLVIYDSQGFESFTAGNVNGQNGFVSTNSATGYTIVDDPTASGRGNVLQVNDPSRVYARLNILGTSGNTRPAVTDSMYMHISFSAFVADGAFSFVVKGSGGQFMSIALDAGAGQNMNILSRITDGSGANATRVLNNTSDYLPGNGSWHDFEVIIKYTDENQDWREFSFYVDGERMDTAVPSTFITTWKSYAADIEYLEFNSLTSSAFNTYIDDLRIEYNDFASPIPEPASVGMLLLGGGAVIMARRKFHS